MDVMEAIRARRSIRSFQSRPIEDEKLDRVLEAGRLAPSAKNMQEWKYIVVKSESMRKELARAAKGQSFVAEAPVVIVACGTITDYVMTCGQVTYPIDLAIAVDHMTLEAVEQGLGTCWIGAFFEPEVKKLLNIPKDIRMVALLPIGYPKDIPSPRPRKPKEEVFISEKWA